MTSLDHTGSYYAAFSVAMVGTVYGMYSLIKVRSSAHVIMSSQILKKRQ